MVGMAATALRLFVRREEEFVGGERRSSELFKSATRWLTCFLWEGTKKRNEDLIALPVATFTPGTRSLLDKSGFAQAFGFIWENEALKCVIYCIDQLSFFRKVSYCHLCPKI